MWSWRVACTGLLLCLVHPALGRSDGLRGDPAAIRDAMAMVETMGGAAIWSRLKSVHFVHRWHPWHRVDSYLEDEILDLTGPRSWVKMESEIHHRQRVYSPEHGYWTVENGQFARGSDEQLKNALERAPYHFCRLARRIAIADPDLEVRLGPGDIPETRRLEFYGPDGVMHGWIILNARKEPIVWATTQYRYTFGPMARFGNLRVPNWAVYENGVTSYEMISLTGSDQAPSLPLFAPPEPGASVELDTDSRRLP